MSMEVSQDVLSKNDFTFVVSYRPVHYSEQKHPSISESMKVADTA
eukprot:COSAG06_NODE_3228_length_5648_cov_3.075329_3_plen_45_part_00